MRKSRLPHIQSAPKPIKLSSAFCKHPQPSSYVSHASDASSCGSLAGNSPAHVKRARALAQSFHKHGVKLVFSGGNPGVMGALAKKLVRSSGPGAVHGVILTDLVQFERDYSEKRKSTCLYRRRVTSRSSFELLSCLRCIRGSRLWCGKFMLGGLGADLWH